MILNSESNQSEIWINSGFQMGFVSNRLCHFLFLNDRFWQSVSYSQATHTLKWRLHLTLICLHLLILA